MTSSKQRLNLRDKHLRRLYTTVCLYLCPTLVTILRLTLDAYCNIFTLYINFYPFPLLLPLPAILSNFSLCFTLVLKQTFWAEERKNLLDQNFCFGLSKSGSAGPNFTLVLLLLLFGNRLTLHLIDSPGVYAYCLRC